MRRQLVTAALLSAVKAVALVGLPILMLQAYVLVHRDDLIVRWFGLTVPVRLTGLIGYDSLVLVILFTVLAVMVYRGSGRFANALNDLADMADRLGRGDTKVTPMKSGIGEVDRVSVVIARSAQNLARSLSSEREFASDASHQLRTPLTALLMRLEEISYTPDPAVVKEEANIAISQVERLTKVVDDLLMRSRRTADPAQLEVSLDTVIANLQREWQPAFEQARRSIYVHGVRDVRVRATESALSQILSTLLENSLIHGKGTVGIDVRHSGPSVVIEVADQGDGVPTELAPHIFERSVTSGRPGSTGLGLALARDLAESLGGRLDLVSMVPATFALFLSESAGRRQP